MGTGLFTWSPSENMGKSSAWWFFCWRSSRKQIRKAYEKESFLSAQKLLFSYIPDTQGAEGWIVKWLADKYNWKKAGK
jgi:hypothetical protein